MTRKADHTFVIVAHKNSIFLEGCIRSVLNQTIKSGVKICTSTPTKLVCNLGKKYKIKVLVNMENSGIGNDWTFAYNNCNTKYCTLAHQDDTYLQDYTKTCLETVNKHPNNLITFTDYFEQGALNALPVSFNLIVKRASLKVNFWFKQKLEKPWRKRLLTSFGSPISCPSVMYNKKNIGRFGFDNDLKVNLDWDAWYKLSAKKGSFLYIPKKLIKHRIHNESETHKAIKCGVRKKEDMLMFNKLWPKEIAKILHILYSWSYRSENY